MTVNASELIKIGQLKKPYGIKGWLWVFSDTDDRSAIFEMQPFVIKTAAGFKTLTVKNWRKQGSGLVAQFEEIPDRNLAETMNGVSIWINKSSLPEAGKDEFYWSDLIGLFVVNVDGVCLGKIKELFETGANDVMVVEPTSDSVDEEQRLIPWHKQVVVTVDIESKDTNANVGTVTVDWQTDF